MEYFTIVLYVIFQFFKVIQSDKLIAATLVVNHGDTIPEKFYPTDPYQDPSFWNKPLGQLSNLGEKQSFEVGKWLLNRYINRNPLVPLHYNASLVYTYSEDRDESLMSGECIMAGFLPPVGDEIWKRDLLWRPTPVHNSPLFLDHAIGRGRDCPRYETMLRRVLHGRYFRTLNIEEQKLLEYLTNHTGEAFTNIGQIPALFNILQVESNHNLTLPEWTHAVFPNTLAKVVLEDSIMRTKNPEIALLSIGPFFNKIQEQFNDILNHSSVVGNTAGTVRKFRMYISNDTLIYDILHALNVSPVGVIPFSAALAFELWETDGGKHYVKLLYKKPPQDHDLIVKLKIPGCKSFRCPYFNFDKIIENLAIPLPLWLQLCEPYVSGIMYTN